MKLSKSIIRKLIINKEHPFDSGAWEGEEVGGGGLVNGVQLG